MRRPRNRRPALALAPIALAALALATLTTTATLAGASAPTQEASPAARSLAQCTAGADRLLVLLLVDESGSLQDTDPGDARVAGVQAALTGLSRLAEEQPDGHSFAVEVRVATFAHGYQPLWDDWRPLDPGSVDGMLAGVGGLAERDQGMDTDYATALTEARTDLADRAAEAGGDVDATCKALVFFTDGMFDIGDRAEGRRAELPATVPWADVRLDEPGGGARAVAAGSDYLCRPGGLGDQLVADGVVTLTVALDTQMEPDARNFLDRLTDGRDPAGGSCGTERTEADGLYLSVGQPERIVFMFASLPDQPPPIQFCPRPEAGPCTFDVPEGATSFLLTAVAPVDGVGIVLTPPSGGPVRLPAGSDTAVEVGDAELAVRPFSDHATEVAATATGDGDWAGRWTLAFTAPPDAELDEPVLYTLALRADLVPELVSDPVVETGERAELDLALVGPSGPVTDGNPLVDEARINATIVEPDGEATELDVEPVGRGRFTASYPVPDELEVDEVDLVLEAALGELEGVAVDSRPTSVPLEVRLPADYPEVGELVMSAVTGDGASRGSMTVRAGKRSGGTVCPGTGQVDLPGEGEAFLVPRVDVPEGAEDGCLHLEAGESARLDVVVDVRRQEAGRATGELGLRVGSDAAPGEERPITRRLDFDMRKDPGGVFPVLLFLLLMAVALGVPLLFLHLLNVLAGRLAGPGEIRSCAFPAHVGPDGLRGTDGRPLEVSFEAFKIAGSGSHPRRELVLQGGVRVLVRASGKRGERLSLLTGPYAVAEAAPRAVLAGTEDRTLARFTSVHRHEVPLGLAGTWIFVVERWGTPTSPTTGTLVLVIPNGEQVGVGPHESARRVLAVAQEQLPELVRLAELDPAVHDEPLAEEPTSRRFRMPTVPKRSSRPGRPTEPEPDGSTTPAKPTGARRRAIPTPSAKPTTTTTPPALPPGPEADTGGPKPGPYDDIELP